MRSRRVRFFSVSSTSTAMTSAPVASDEREVGSVEFSMPVPMTPNDRGRNRFAGSVLGRTVFTVTEERLFVELRFELRSERRRRDHVGHQRETYPRRSQPIEACASQALGGCRE